MNKQIDTYLHTYLLTHTVCHDDGIHVYGFFEKSRDQLWDLSKGHPLQHSTVHKARNGHSNIFADEKPFVGKIKRNLLIKYQPFL